MNDNLSNLLSLVAVQDARWAVARLAVGAGFQCPASKQVQCFLMVDGTTYLHIGGASGKASAVKLTAGDIVLSLGGANITICENPNNSTPAEVLPDGPSHDQLPWLQIGKQEPRALMIVGRFEIEPVRWGPIKRAVPDVVVTHSDTGEPPYWAGPLGGVRPLQLALSGDGSAALSRRLAEICVIQVIRTHEMTGRPSARQAEGPATDPRITEAVQLINAKPATNWTVESLARKVGMSRSVFSEAFDKSIGEAPIRYLTRVRMTIAAQMLRNHSAPLIEIAHQVGYSSDISLIRTFKRFFGVTPTEFRNHLNANESRSVANFPLAHPAFVFDGPTSHR